MTTAILLFDCLLLYAILTYLKISRIPIAISRQPLHTHHPFFFRPFHPFHPFTSSQRPFQCLVLSVHCEQLLALCPFPRYSSDSRRHLVYICLHWFSGLHLATLFTPALLSDRSRHPVSSITFWHPARDETDAIEVLIGETKKRDLVCLPVLLAHAPLSLLVSLLFVPCPIIHLSITCQYSILVPLPKFCRLSPENLHPFAHPLAWNSSFTA